MGEQPDKLAGGLAPERGEEIKWIMSEFEVDILTAIYWRLVAPWSLASRRVNDSFFLFPAQGAVKVTSEGEVYRASPGEFIMLRDNVEHSVELAEGHERLEMVAVHCHIANIWRVPLLNFFARPHGRLRDANADLAELCAFVSLFNADSHTGRNWGSCILKSLLAHEVLDGAPLRARTERFDQRVGKSLLRIHGFYDQELSVDGLASDNRLSVVQFRKLFKLHIGMGPKEYLVQYRLKVAKDLLQKSNYSLKRIAENVGFQSVQYFHSVFRRHFKCTPTEFRRGPGRV